MKSEGNKVTFNSMFSPRYPDNVIVPSAITRAKVPASVESRPPLYVPRESLDDMTRDSSDRFTPGIDQTDGVRLQVKKFVWQDKVDLFTFKDFCCDECNES